MKTTIVIGAVLGMCCCLVSCGGRPFRFEGGNWALSGTSSMTAGQTLALGGELTGTASQVNGTLCYSLTPASCTGTRLQFNGEEAGRIAVLTSSPASDGTVITLHLNWSDPTSVAGDYQVKQNSMLMDEGTISGNLVPSINGNWTGSSTGPSGVTLSATITQAQTASSDGSYKLTLSNISLTGPTCYTAATTGDGFVIGGTVMIGFEIHDDTQFAGIADFQGVIGNLTANSMSGEYGYQSFGCGLGGTPLTLTRQ